VGFCFKASNNLAKFWGFGINYCGDAHIESVNALAEKVCGKIDNWKNSSQKARWLASALTDIEPKLHRVKGHEHLGELRVALKAELSL
jgi:Cys-tRNA synthase (O-phospho-L-seryl-tRNA:Cys-tRNA synthase)